MRRQELASCLPAGTVDITLTVHPICVPSRHPTLGALDQLDVEAGSDDPLMRGDWREACALL